jgi:glycosyltransferase 2 family protein
MAKKKQLILTAIKLGVSGLLIYWILRNTNLGDIVTVMGAANLPLLAIAASLKFVGYYVSAQRWRVLLKAQGIDASISFLVQSYLVGAFFSNFLPSIIGGDTVRAYDSWRLGKNRAGAVAVILVDRFLGALVLVLFAIGALFVSTDLIAHLPFLQVWMLLIAASMLLVTWMIFMPPQWLSVSFKTIKLPLLRQLTALLEKLKNAFLAFQGQRTVLFEALGLSALLQLNVIIHYYLIAKALDFSIPFHNFFLIIPLSLFIMMLPISINAIGIRESVFFFFFSAFSVLKPEAVAFSWLSYGILMVQGLVGGIVYALRK